MKIKPYDHSGSGCRSRAIGRGGASANGAQMGACAPKRRSRSIRSSVWAAEEIAKRTNGRYKIDVFPASTVAQGSRYQSRAEARHGRYHHFRIELCCRDYKPIGVTYFPYIFRGPEHLIAYTKSDVFKRLAAGYETKSGNHIAAVSYYGTRQTTSNKPIAKCSDMQGLKIRVPDVPAYLAMPRACGANTTPIAFAEVYLALQNGTVEAQENPLTTIEAKKFFEVQKNIILTGHIVDHLNTVISKQLWASLSDEDKKIFGDVMQEAAERTTKIISEKEKKLVATFKEKGINVTEVDKADFEKNVVEKVKFEDFGYEKSDWEAIRAIKE